MLEVDTLAMREAGKNKPKGAKFNKAVAKLLRLYELDIIHKSDRSRMRKFAGKLELIDAWRSEQSLERQFELNHPRVVYKAWNHAQGEKQSPKSDPKRSEREPPKSDPKKPEGAPDLVAILDATTDDKVVTAELAGLGELLPNVPMRTILSGRIEEGTL